MLFESIRIAAAVRARVVVETALDASKATNVRAVRTRVALD